MINIKRIYFRVIKKKREGFTLVELLVTIAIIVLLAVFSIPQFRVFGAQAELKENGNQIAAVVSKTQGLALAPRTEDRNIDQYAIELSNVGNQVNWKIFKYNEEDRQPVESGVLSSNIIWEKYQYINGDSIGPKLDPAAILLRYQIATGKIVNANTDLKLFLSHKKLTGNQQIEVDINLITGKTEVK